MTQPLATPTANPPPGLSRRLAAIVYDALAVLAIAILLWLVIGSVGVALNDGEQVMDSLLLKLVSWSVLPLICLGFFTIFWRKSGQTLGMQAWKLKLTDHAGRQPTVQQCVIRIIAATVSAACAGLGYWWIWIDRDKLAWHDRISGTRLQLLNKEEIKRKAKAMRDVS